MIQIFNFQRAVRRYIRNLIKWSPILWSDRDFDYAYLLIIINKKLKMMEQFFLSDKTITKSAAKHGKQIRTARILTDRIIEDDYFNLSLFKSSNIKFKIKHADYMKMQDLNYLNTILNKYMLGWWD
jgi:hypothetical protein